MANSSNKTVMCSVLFLDIVEYSKKPVAVQIALKERFNGYLSAATHSLSAEDRIVLDAGDGAAISFLGDIGDALEVAFRLRASLLNEAPDIEPRMQLRMGVNLGPVRLVMDINGQPNVVGDGVNVAQRIMGFAEPGQILISRTYYEAVAHLSAQYGVIFSYQGSRTDKHVREHEIYAVVKPGETTPAILPEASVASEGAAFPGWMQARSLYIGIVAVVMLLAAVLIFKPDGSDRRATVTVGPVVQTEGGAQPSVPTPSVTPPATATATEAAVEKQAGAAQPIQQLKSSVDKRGGAEAYVTVVCKNDKVRVFVDHSQKGSVSYDKLTLTLKPGNYTVLVKHDSGLLHKQKVSLVAGGSTTITPKFCN